jgi:hypothetical protein
LIGAAQHDGLLHYELRPPSFRGSHTYVSVHMLVMDVDVMDVKGAFL